MIILTGGAGFIGSVILQALNAKGINDIIIVDNLGTSDKWKNLVEKNFKAFIHRDDFIEKLKDREFAKSIEAIIHMGACSFTTERDADYLMRNNVDYSISLAKIAAEYGIRFIYASSGATYGSGKLGYSDDLTNLPKLRPTNAYGFSKHFFDLWMNHENLLNKGVGIKFFNVYGPNEYHKANQASPVKRLWTEVKEKGVVTLFESMNPNYKNGEQKRDFIYVKDCADVVLWLLENKKVTGLFNLGTGKARTWKDLAQSVFSALKKEPNIVYATMPENLREHYQYFTEASITKLRASGYKKLFTPLEDGIREYVTQYLESDHPYV